MTWALQFQGGKRSVPGSSVASAESGEESNAGWHMSSSTLSDVGILLEVVHVTSQEHLLKRTAVEGPRWDQAQNASLEQTKT